MAPRPPARVDKMPLFYPTREQLDGMLAPPRGSAPAAADAMNEPLQHDSIPQPTSSEDENGAEDSPSESDDAAVRAQIIVNYQ